MEGKCLVFHVKVLSKFVWLLPSAESVVATRYATFFQLQCFIYPQAVDILQSFILNYAAIMQG